MFRVAVNCLLLALCNQFGVLIIDNYGGARARVCVCVCVCVHACACELARACVYGQKAWVNCAMNGVSIN